MKAVTFSRDEISFPELDIALNVSQIKSGETSTHLQVKSDQAGPLESAQHN